MGSALQGVWLGHRAHPLHHCHCSPGLAATCYPTLGLQNSIHRFQPELNGALKAFC